MLQQKDGWARSSSYANGWCILQEWLFSANCSASRMNRNLCFPIHWSLGSNRIYRNEMPPYCEKDVSCPAPRRIPYSKTRLSAENHQETLAYFAKLWPLFPYGARFVQGSVPIWSGMSQSRTLAKSPDCPVRQLPDVGGDRIVGAEPKL